MSARPCAWCEQAIPADARRDSKFCGRRCRQASWRFGVRRCELVATSRPMRFAYADPPYPGKAGLYPEREEVDHAQLVERLVAGYPDGWALSTSSGALREVWALCPPDTRLRVWLKNSRRARARDALQSYEALLVWGGRPLPTDVVQDLEDSLVARGRFRAFPGALVGMKPPQFAVWMFRLLGARLGDSLDDLFPGSGAISLAWERYASPPPGEDVSRLQPPDVSRPAVETRRVA